MSRRQPPFRSSVTLAGATLAIATGITVAAASTVSALTLPAPTPPPTPVAPAVTGLVGQVTAPLTSSLGGVSTSSPSGSATGLPALPGMPAAPSSSLGAVGAGVKSALSTARTKAAGTPVAPLVPGSGPGGVVDLAVNASPLATACLQVTGSGTAVANTTVTVGGKNVSAPLVQALPGLLAPCPRGSVPSTPGLDASVPGLVGACVRATPQPPLHASLLVLDRELVSGLTRAGVPLQQAVVPCPAGTAQAVGAGPVHSGSGSAAHPGGSTATPARPTGSRGSAAHGGTCAPSSSNGGSDDTSIDARTTAAAILPHDAPQALPWALLVLALVGRRRLGRMVGALRGAPAVR